MNTLFTKIIHPLGLFFFFKFCYTSYSELIGIAHRRFLPLYFHLIITAASTQVCLNVLFQSSLHRARNVKIQQQHFVFGPKYEIMSFQNLPWKTLES